MTLQYNSGVVVENGCTMYLQRELWLKKHSQEKLPPWPCPRACGGTLQAQKKSFASESTHESLQHRDNERWELDWDRGVIVGLLLCSRCMEAVAIGGDQTQAYEFDWDQVTNQPSPYFEQFIRPVWFHPPLPFFPVPDDVPEEVRTPLMEAFATAWVSPSSAAARIRAALETLMDANKVQRKKRKTNGTYYELKLHPRLEIFGEKHPKIQEHLLAAKWLGNVGAHESDLSDDVLLDAFEFVSIVLHHLYDDRVKRADDRVRVVNKSKGKK